MTILSELYIQDSISMSAPSHTNVLSGTITKLRAVSMHLQFKGVYYVLMFLLRVVDQFDSM